MTNKRLVLLTFAAPLLAGCGVASIVKEGLATYQEPVDGPRARLRLVSNQPSPRIYPGTTCASTADEGAGAAPMSPRLGKGGYRTIGMPKAAVEGGRSVTEIYVRAGEPIVFRLAAGGCTDRGCPVDKWSCFASRSFVPVAGEDYVATILRDDDACPVELYRIEVKGEMVSLHPQVTEIAKSCAE